jgi:hypothetical protein
MHATTVSGDNDDTTSNPDDAEIKVFPKFISQIFILKMDAQSVCDQCSVVVP